MTLLLIFGFLFFVFYLGVSILKFGIPTSLSNTYYLWEDYYGTGKFFRYLMITIAFTITPFWLSVSPLGHAGLVFFGSTVLGFVGMAYKFKRDNEKYIHFGAAIISGVLAIIWIILNDFVEILFFNFLFFGIITLFNYKNYLFYVEMVAFSSIYLILLSMI